MKFRRRRGILLKLILVLSMAALLMAIVAQAAEPGHVVEAAEILEKIEAGQPVEYDGVTIVGDLDISGLDLPRMPVERTLYEKYILRLPDYEMLVASPINITNSTIRDSVQLNSTSLQAEVDFWNTEFEEPAYFIGARFNQYAGFWDARFNQYAGFWDARFNQYADFRDARFNDIITFVDARFNDISFNNSQFSQEAFFDGARINGTLSLYRTKYDKLNIRWSAIHDLSYDETAYYLLIENFKRLGFSDDARECYYSYRCKHGPELLRQGKPLNWLFDSLAYWTYGYGLRPERPLGWSLFLIIAAGVFFWRSRGFRRSEGQGDVSLPEAVLLSATYFSSGASDIISSASEEFKPHGSARYAIVFLRISGWIFFILFLATLGQTIGGGW